MLLVWSYSCSISKNIDEGNKLKANVSPERAQGRVFLRTEQVRSKLGNLKNNAGLESPCLRPTKSLSLTMCGGTFGLN